MAKLPKGRRRAIAIVGIALLVLALCALVYLFAFRTFTLVSDSAFSQLLSGGQTMKMRLSFAMQGVRLRIVELKDSAFSMQPEFEQSISSLRGSQILLGPLASAYAVMNGIDVSGLLPKSIVIGIWGGEATALFDCTLKSNELSGWVQAASSLEAETRAMSQNIALVVDSDSGEIKHAIENTFPKGRLSVYEYDGTSRLFVTETASTMDRTSVVIAMCPYLDRLEDFFQSEYSANWVVDYRFRHVVPSGQLYGIVCPDMLSVLDLVREVRKGERSVISLGYVYEKV